MDLPVALRPPAVRGYAMTMRMSATGFASESPLFLFNYAFRLLRVVLLVSVWRTLMPADGAVAGFTVGAVLTYTLMAEAFHDQLDVRTELSWTIWNGTVVTRYLQPIGMVGLYAAEAAGRWLFGLLVFSVPLLLIASPLLGVSPLPASPAHGALFVPSLLLAVTVGIAIDFVFGALVVIMNENIWVIDVVRSAVGILVSGALIPLQLMPWGLGEVLAWLPFAAMASAPLRIYTGSDDALLLLASQLFWAIALWPFTLWLWRINREKLAGLGG